MRRRKTARQPGQQPRRPKLLPSRVESVDGGRGGGCEGGEGEAGEADGVVGLVGGDVVGGDVAAVDE